MTWERQQSRAEAELKTLIEKKLTLPAGKDFGYSTEEVYEFWRTIGFPEPDASDMASIDQSSDWPPLD